MPEPADIKKLFKEKKETFFSLRKIIENSFQTSLEYSVFIEQIIIEIVGTKKLDFAIASSGSFSRRELSQYSDIDLFFIVENGKDLDPEINILVTQLWDSGIEISHTVRDASDIKKFLDEDLHSFTQLFETRFIVGAMNVYDNWNQALLDSVTHEVKEKLVKALIEDAERRYQKFGNSPKVIEPNVKQTAGGLRDLQLLEWLYLIHHEEPLNKQKELTQSEIFIKVLAEEKITTEKECERLHNSYKFILTVRNLLHFIHKQRNDRLEFEDQIKIARYLQHKKEGYRSFMKDYFHASNVIFRLKKSILKRYRIEFNYKLPDLLQIELDPEFTIKAGIISYQGKQFLNMASILKVFYHRAFHNARFDENLRTIIIDSIDNKEQRVGPGSAIYFRKLLALQKNVGNTLTTMNELGVLEVFISEFKEMNGFIQHGVYHCYTADEHTLKTISNIEKLDDVHSPFYQLFIRMENREILYLALLFHDIAKPINIVGHEIIGADMARTIMGRLGYDDDEIDKVAFLVQNHLMMEKIAFRRNLNDPETLNSFVSIFDSVELLDYLYLLTYADLSAVNPALWTSWKYDLLNELYRKAKSMIEEKLSGEDLLFTTTSILPHEVSKHSENISDLHVQEHINSINDITYLSHFSEEEIAKHIEEINAGLTVSVLFKELENFTNVTIITNDSSGLLSKLCGVFAINDCNIHDAKIFTRKDGIVIDNFNVTDFRSHKKIDPERYKKLEENFYSVLSDLLQLNVEISNMKSRWWRIENRFLKKQGQVRIKFEEQEKFTIIDVHSPDRLGFLYQVTSKMYDLGLIIYFAKIATKGDEIVDAFYVLDRDQKKISKNYYNFIEMQLTEAINQIL
ncbi:MAG: [protein-PII] uridylyltransferase [Chlorobiaceae bacterium]|nr:[protein-PII] uridylyltransferase [Chlorobiaceae bacterium]